MKLIEKKQQTNKTTTETKTKNTKNKKKSNKKGTVSVKYLQLSLNFLIQLFVNHICNMKLCFKITVFRYQSIIFQGFFQ